MTLPRVAELMGAWAASPPMNWSISALAGFKPPSKIAGQSTEQDLSSMFGIEGIKRG